jgi:hypothetical protein
MFQKRRRKETWKEPYLEKRLRKEIWKMGEQKSETAAMEYALRGVWYAHVSKEI